MTSAVAICNLALSNIGKDNVVSLTEASAEARACNQFYDHVRDTLLQSYPWRFAGKTVSLAEIANGEAGRWLYAYRYPTDALKVRWVRPSFSASDPCVQTMQQEINNPFDVEGGVIFCDLSPAFLRYTFKQVDTSKYPPLFIEAFAWHLAVRLAMPLTRDPKMRAEAFQLAQAAQAKAEAADANETRNTSDHDSDLQEAR